MSSIVSILSASNCFKPLLKIDKNHLENELKRMETTKEVRIRLLKRKVKNLRRVVRMHEEKGEGHLRMKKELNEELLKMHQK